jgi:GrpB-like predicted nucleotidyltransferase (UPF0157 family)
MKNKNEFPILKYDPRFKLYYEAESKYLTKNLGDKFKVYHVGSTSVPGLGGKHILDILLLSPIKREAIKIFKKMERLTYVNPPNSGDKFRIVFKRDMRYGNRKIRVHVHLMWKTSKRYKNYFLFRDYLRSHPREAQKYFRLKKYWWKKSNYDRKAYSKMKTGYVFGVIEKAIKEKKEKWASRKT